MKITNKNMSIKSLTGYIFKLIKSSEFLLYDEYFTHREEIMGILDYDYNSNKSIQSLSRRSSRIMYNSEIIRNLDNYTKQIFPIYCYVRKGES